LVKERTRLVNRMKGTLARLGIRNFKPTLRQAAERLWSYQAVPMVRIRLPPPKM
jgi:transposase